LSGRGRCFRFLADFFGKAGLQKGQAVDYLMNKVPIAAIVTVKRTDDLRHRRLILDFEFATKGVRQGAFYQIAQDRFALAGDRIPHGRASKMRE
jgi:hypothetical protein